MEQEMEQEPEPPGNAYPWEQRTEQEGIQGGGWAAFLEDALKNPWAAGSVPCPEHFLSSYVSEP